ncbi:MAG: alpha-maltose-phosphate synthase [Acidimicrobiaceae bacterium]|nr:alpha-maltose-phosphate synthase [Acidimicrobiaceae bacterium]
MTSECRAPWVGSAGRHDEDCWGEPVRVALLTREYPPDVYGGAGVHVEYLSRELARIVDVTVHCWGDDRPSTPNGPRVVGHRPSERAAGQADHGPVLDALSIDLAMAEACAGADLVHSHTWYANLAGHLAKLLHGAPHVATVHSLEPLRPWKAEQLGGGYAVSSYCERTGLESADAVIAVSSAVADDVCRVYPSIAPERVHVIHNGVDPQDYRPERAAGAALLDRFGVDPSRPVVLFVGRITRQKGIHLLLEAVRDLPVGVQVVLRAGSPDTAEIEREVAEGVAAAKAEGHEVTVIESSLAREELTALIGAATVLCCPSVYEPFGLVNVEAMACAVPVVASAVGGIPEAVEHGTTGLLVPVEARADGTGQPTDPSAYARDLAAALTRLVEDPELAAKMGEAGRQRVVDRFSWRQVAARTCALYERILG